MVEKLIRSDKEWRRILPPGRYGVLFKNGTEPPFDNEYNNFWEPGIYLCYACDLPLFSSETKFRSSSGWPSFWQPISPVAIEQHVDRSLWMRRTAVVCARCGGPSLNTCPRWPPPTGLRYCMNSASLKFVPD
jgi:peptide-methionine (R)-S-oxide reductase